MPLDVQKSPAAPSGEEDLVRILQEVLIDTSATSATILRCDRVHHRQRDGQRGTTQYNIEIGHSGEASPVRVLVTTLSLGGNRTRRVWNQLVQSGRAGIVDASGIRAFAYLPDLDLLVQVFPHDARLPALQQLVPAPSPAIAAALDRDRQRVFSGEGAWVGASVRYRPEMRATVQIDDVSTGDMPRSAGFRYFAKVYREPEKAQHAFSVQAALMQAGVSGSSTLQVARPVPLDPALNTLLTRAVPGVSLEQWLKREADYDHALRKTARAVAELHDLTIDAPSRSIEMELAQAREAADVIVEVDPDLAPQVRDILGSVSAALQNAPTGFIHGDLKPEHVVIDEPAVRVSVLDFDLCAVADPILDIAHLLAFLGKPSSHAPGRSAQTLSPGRVFLDAYFSHAPGDGRARIACYHAITALHRAAGLCRSRGEDAGEQVTAVLDEGLRYLSGEVDETTSPSYRRRMTRTI